MYIPPELWTRILEYTDIKTCLAFNDSRALKSFLKTWHDWNKGAISAAELGKLDQVKFLLYSKDRPRAPQLLNKDQHLLPVKIIETAVHQGDTQIVQLVFEQGIELVTGWRIMDDVCKLPKEAAKRGHTQIALMILRALLGSETQTWHFVKALQSSIKSAAEFGALDTLKVLLNFGKENNDKLQSFHMEEFEQSAVSNAIKGGQLQTLNWLKDDLPEGFTYSTMACALEANQLTSIQYLLSNGLGILLPSKNTAHHAVKICRLDVLQFIEARCPAAIPKASIDDIDFSLPSAQQTLEYLHQRHAKCSKQAMDKAAGAGNLQSVKFLHTHRKEGCSDEAIDNAVQGGHLFMLKWLTDVKSMKLEEWHVDTAISWCEVDVLEWLLGQVNYNKKQSLFGFPCFMKKPNREDVRLCSVLKRHWPELLCEQADRALKRALDFEQMDIVDYLTEQIPAEYFKSEYGSDIAKHLARNQLKAAYWIYTHQRRWAKNLWGSACIETEKGVILDLQSWLVSGAEQRISGIRYHSGHNWESTEVFDELLHFKVRCHITSDPVWNGMVSVVTSVCNEKFAIQRSLSSGLTLVLQKYTMLNLNSCF